MTAFYVGRINPRDVQCAPTKKRGRKSDENLSKHLSKFFEYLESNDECQYSMTELHGILYSLSDEQTEGACTKKWSQHKLRLRGKF